MAQHKHKHKTNHSASTVHHAPVKAKRSAASVLAALVAVLGFAAAYFTQGFDLLWIITGTVIGGAVGYLVGGSIDRSVSKA